MKMDYLILDSRCRKILDYLTSQDDYLTIEEIGRSLSMGSNSTKYSLLKINRLFTGQGLGCLEKKYGTGTRLTRDQKDWWLQISANGKGLEYIFTQDERMAVIICQIILARQRFSVDEIADFLRVSRNTVFADLRNIKEMLARYRIRLSYDSRTGYALYGDEFLLRGLLLRQYDVLAKLIEHGILEIFDYNAFLDYRRKIHLLQDDLNVEYVPGVIDKLAVLLLYTYGICGEHAKETPFTEEQLEEIVLSREYTAVSKYFPDLPATDKAYFTCQLLGNRVQDELSGFSFSCRQSIASANKLVMFFERLTGISFDDRESLISDLSKHISRAIYRYKYGMIFQEQTVSHTLRNQNEEVLSIVRLITDELCEDIGYPVDNDEIERLTDYFQKYLQHIPFEFTKDRFGRLLDEMDDLMYRLRPYINKDSYGKVRNEIISFLFGKTYTLRDIVEPDFVQTKLSPVSWEDAIRITAKPILAKDYITADYIDSMINSVLMYGSYSFIADGVYLAHAEINGNVNKLSMAIGTFSGLVVFPENKPVRMLLVLCPIDKHSHFDAFKGIVGICSQKEVLEPIIQSESPKELLNKLLTMEVT